MVVRMVVVVPERPTRKTNFSQISRRMSALISALMPPALAAARRASARGEETPSNSPKTRRCIVPVWRITPGRSIVVAT